MPPTPPPTIDLPYSSVSGPRGRDEARPAQLRTAAAAGCGLLLLLAGCTAGVAASATSPTAPSTTAPTNTAPVSTMTAIPAPAAGGWRLNGTARLAAGAVRLTATRARSAGSAIWPHPLRGITSLEASFDVQMGGGTGADGVTFALIDARTGRPTSLGRIGGGLGWAGIPGRAIALDTFQNPGDPSYNDIGLVTGFDPRRTDQLRWADSATAIPPLRNSVRHITVTVDHQLLTVSVDNAVAFTALLTLPRTLLVGFTGATGARTDRHVVSNVDIRVG